MHKCMSINVAISAIKLTFQNTNNTCEALVYNVMMMATESD